jgi:hypothetical protein
LRENTETELTGKERACSNWIHVAHNMDKMWAVPNMVMNLWAPQNAGNFLTGISRRTLPHEVTHRYCGEGIFRERFKFFWHIMLHHRATGS